MNNKTKCLKATKQSIKTTIALSIIILVCCILTSGIKKSDYERGGYTNLVEKLYQNEVVNNSTLNKIETDIRKFYKSKATAIDQFNDYNEYHKKYYNDALSNLNNIKDVVLKTKAKELVDKGLFEYNAKVATLKNNIVNLENQAIAIEDNRTLLQLIITKPIIEKEQNSNLPTTNNILETSKEAISIINAIQVLIK